MANLGRGQRLLVPLFPPLPPLPQRHGMRALTDNSLLEIPYGSSIQCLSVHIEEFFPLGFFPADLPIGGLHANPSASNCWRRSGDMVSLFSR